MSNKALAGPLHANFAQRLRQALSNKTVFNSSLYRIENNTIVQ